ncbi:hypothetical protein [Paraburkholderia tropica]|uniref:hypothetical protein n=1 Tax=Paraburkholderia tropica TaxID=92647 RepID=UPI002AB7CB05|nr:hypothetical protein [Paraburkholderia tropica]
MSTFESMSTAQLLATLEAQALEAVNVPARSATKQIADVFHLLESARQRGVARSDLVALLNRTGIQIGLPGFESALKRLRRRQQQHVEPERTHDARPGGPTQAPRGSGADVAAVELSTPLPSAADLQAEDPTLSPAMARKKAAEAAYREAAAGTTLMERFKRN